MSNLKFPATYGFQGQRRVFLIQIPFNRVNDIFHIPKVADLSKSYQRNINEKRKVQISDYINKNDNFVLPTVVAFPVRGDFEFKRFQDDVIDFGTVELSQDCKLGLFDGQHRISGIIEALKNSTSGDLSICTIPVMLFDKPSLQAAQQIFSDINLNAVKPSQSIKLFYDNRDLMSNLTKHIISTIPLLTELVDLGTSNLPKDSPQLFSFSAVYGAVQEMYKGLDPELGFEKKSELVIEFWKVLCESFLPWLEVYEQRVTSEFLRENSLAPFAVTLQAIGNFGKNIVTTHPQNWQEYIPKLLNVSFHKNNPQWINRVIQQGKIKKSRTNSILISNVILSSLDLKLTGENLAAESKFLGH